MSKFYITTSIPYVNGPPHIGHALEFVQADAIARWHRLCGEDVFFLTGTDEHGAKIARAAEVAGTDAKTFVDEQSQRFRDLIKQLAVTPDDMIRTSDKKRHWPGAEEMWRRMAKRGDIYKGVYKGLYCIGHEAFVTEKDLQDGICEDHGKAPEYIEEENYFFHLSEYAGEVKRQIEAGYLEVVPHARMNEILMFLGDDVEDISFSRPAKDIPWGIPVPDDSSNNMYVWCDALTNYISALGFGTSSDDRMRMYWPCDIHLVGKDIARFHAILWPAMLLSAGLPLPKKIFVHGHIHSGGRKMSKTLGNVIDPFSLIEIYGAEAVRYVLLGHVPLFSDADLTVDRIHELYTAHLVNGVGNLVSRVSAMSLQYFEGTITRPTDALLASVPLKSDIDVIDARDRDLKVGSITLEWFIRENTIPRYLAAWEEYRLDGALQEVMQLLRMLDGYIQDYEPYKLIKIDPEQTQAILWGLVSSIHRASRLLAPFLPGTALAIAGALGVSPDETDGATRKRVEYKITKKEFLFPRIEKK
ncbi:MAG: methionine--tRNA ligase [Candidatus Ryanbacteria bacterium RIFCSPHIGHO2_02_FULL_45_13b]|uniref:Methionine--tRNA ligase n=1 Tax=Candidatus Ryanbacteria bacterium RIFCSPHIGHO2_02_FULL_45_13b TaxID=1802117 RepID=A0A1G2GAF4_9BACT|nr:MAG: methionine--tRNA ligase [Candidatus Ryanbacteria bacterium RIFCSPHIGHO2_02_FULL_45_13b]